MCGYWMLAHALIKNSTRSDPHFCVGVVFIGDPSDLEEADAGDTGGTMPWPGLGEAAVHKTKPVREANPMLRR
jgi:hypothetical protein